MAVLKDSRIVSSYQQPEESEFSHEPSATVVNVEKLRLVTGRPTNETQPSDSSRLRPMKPVNDYSGTEEEEVEEEPVLLVNTGTQENTTNTTVESTDMFSGLEDQGDSNAVEQSTQVKEESKSNEPSILSVWQQERQELLQKKAQEEKQIKEETEKKST